MRYIILGIYLLARISLIIGQSIESLRGYGDFVHFYHLANMGWPFADYWVEFPPIFPFLSTLIYRLAGGREHVYDYLLVLILTLAQAGSLLVFSQILDRIFGSEQVERRIWIYMGSITALFYGWGYFDPLAVLAMLLGLLWVLDGKDVRAGLILAVGVLIKWFPALVLAVAWRYRPIRKAILLTTITLGITALVYAGLYLAFPDMTQASLSAQSSKGSWETPWALLDGNFNTGNFGPELERLDSSAAVKPVGNPAQIPPYLSLVFFAALGGWLYFKFNSDQGQTKIAFLGLTLAIFFLWLPGWSPQWVLYLIPVILLSLPIKEAILLLTSLILVNLCEWPLLLSRGLNWSLWVTIPLRVLLIILLVIEFYKLTEHPVDSLAEER